MYIKSLLLALLCCSAHNVKSAKILGVFHNPSRSHFLLGSTLMEALAKRGHEVTLLAPYGMNTTLDNYEVIEVEGLQLSKDAVIQRVRTVINGTTYEKLRSLQDNYRGIANLFLRHSTFKNVINSNRTYDMVIIDWIFNDAFLGIAEHFKAHSVAFSAQGSSSAVNKLTVNAAPYSYVTNIIPAISDEMTFLQRTANTLGNLLFEFTDIYQRYLQNRLLREHFRSASNVGDLYRKVSLVLLNNHFTVETPRPYVPNMISVGGFHIPEPKPLEKNLKRLLDESTEGVVYFSFGSIIKSSDFGKETLEMLSRAFAKLPYKVLWKFESDDVPEIPPNVIISKWFPQIDVLAHPNVKVFVSHGGLLSILEGVYHAVPTVSVPFFGDHEANAEIAVSKGYGKRLYFHELTEETLSNAIKEVVTNPKYSENVKLRSKWYRDQPMKPLDRAIYWLEYVLRHDGAHHLKTAAVRLSWYQYLLLDVFGFLVAILVAAGIVLRTVVRLIKMMVPKSNVVTPKKFL